MLAHDTKGVLICDTTGVQEGILVVLQVGTPMNEHTLPKNKHTAYALGSWAHPWLGMPNQVIIAPWQAGADSKSQRIVFKGPILRISALVG